MAYNTDVLNGTDVLTLFVDLASLKEYRVDDGKGEPRLPNEAECHSAIPSLSGDFVLYAVNCKSHSRLILRSLATGESKTVMLFGPLSEGTPARTGLTPTHAYWFYGNQNGPNSVSSFDLATGEAKTTTAGVSTCRTTWVRAGQQGDVVLCTNEDAQSVVLVDIANGTATPVSKSQFAQNHGYLSPDGTEAVWLDYRDPGPNGEHGSYDFEFAGEIYWRNLITGEERRLTFDNPTDPIKKAWPSIRNGIVTWEDWRTLAEKNPQGGPGFSLLAAPVRYQKDLDAAAQDLGPADVFYPQATSSGVVALWGGSYPDGGKRPALVRFAWP